MRNIPFFMMLLGSLLLIACPSSRGGGGGGGDDDDAVDDDDSGPDDDDSGPDDDDASSGDCFEETEPNGGVDESQPNDVGDVDDSFCIEGEIDCGNDGESFTGDLDFFVFTAAADASVDFVLDWSGSSTDMDGIVSDPASGEVLHDFEMGYDPESGSFSLASGTQYQLRVGCWEGEDGSWTATFDF